MPSRASRTVPLLALTALAFGLLGETSVSAFRARTIINILFAAAPPPAVPLPKPGPEVIRFRYVTVDAVALLATRSDDINAPIRPTLRLNLFEDIACNADLDRISPADGGLTWIGHVQSLADSTVALAYINGMMSGSVVSPEATYEVRYIGDGVHEVAQIDPTRRHSGAVPLPVGPAGRGVVRAPDVRQQRMTAPGAAEGRTAALAIDDVGIDRIEIWRDPVVGDAVTPWEGSGPGHGKIFLAQPALVPRARPDVEAAYPLSPGAHQMDYGGALSAADTSNPGSDPLQLHVFAFDHEGNWTEVGTRTIDRSGMSDDQRAEALAAPVGGEVVSPNQNANRVVAATQEDNVEVKLPLAGSLGSSGHEIVGYERRRLPPGSTMDGLAGSPTWQPAAGFLGSFDLEFASDDGTSVPVRVVVGPSMRAVIETPQNRAEVSVPFVVAGWAVDLASESGSGVDAAHVWALPVDEDAPNAGRAQAPPDPGPAAIWLGAAAIGPSGADVVRLYGPAFVGASYHLDVNSLVPGTYDLAVYPRRASTGRFEGARTVRIIVR